MGLIGSLYGLQPGMGSVVETFETAFTWGPWPRYYDNAVIDATAQDSGNTPTFDLRAGLVLGKITATGTYRDYSATHTDGSEVASAVVVQSLRMQDVFSGQNKARFYAVMVGGGLQVARALGFDNMARAQMGDHWFFDDDVPGGHTFPWRRFQTKTTSYSIQPADNYSHFDNLGAAGAVTFTLPPVGPGLYFGFHAITAQNLLVSSFEGANIVALNNASANTVAFQTGSQIIGGGFNVYTNAAGTKWVVDNASAGTNAITVS